TNFTCLCCDVLIFLFFFSSRRRHTRCYRDWSSDVCSSDLTGFTQRAFIPPPSPALAGQTFVTDRTGRLATTDSPALAGQALEPRSEERRVGKECRSRLSTYT